MITYNLIVQMSGNMSAKVANVTQWDFNGDNLVVQTKCGNFHYYNQRMILHAQFIKS